MITTFNAETAERAENFITLRILRVLRSIVVTFAVMSWAAPALAQQTHLLVITGVPGDDEHTALFQKWATTFIDAAKKNDKVPDTNITYLSGPNANRAGVEKAFDDLATRVKPNDAVVVLLIGHGSFDGTQGTFNLPGPDPTVADWNKLLSKFSAQHVAFIDTSSSSGAFLPGIAAPGRVVITATKTGGERNETQFPAFFVEAFVDNAGDRDRNGHVSILEAFEYARIKVTDTFKQKGLILTEHATLDDGGDGHLAATLYLGVGRAEAAVDTSDPEMKALVDARTAVERQVEALRLKKPSMDPAQYDAQMESLLTDLALKTKAIRDRQAKKDKP
jgi:hypothetical protein